MTDAQDDGSFVWFATDCKTKFYDSLRLGDVLLFEGYDDMAVLGIYLERRPVYHSALWWGPVNHQQCAVHNVSDLWWDNAARVALRALNNANTNVTLTDNDKPLALAQYWMCGTASVHDAKDENTQVGEAVRKLLAKGGVAPFSVDHYLDETFKEHGTERHKIRSITALRYRSTSTKDTSSALASRVAQAAHEVNKDDGFPAAELVAALPSLFERSDNKAFGAGKIRGAIRRIGMPRVYSALRSVARRKYHSPKERGWICAMFVNKVYCEAGIDLKLGGIRLPKWPELFVTPRDLIDSPTLAPVATLLMKPDPVDREPPSPAPSGSGAMPADSATLKAFPYNLEALQSE